MSSAELNAERRERVRQLAMETVDFTSDPYFFRSHTGHVECRLCRTIHTDETKYLVHTQSKRHSTNLARRARRAGTALPAGTSLGGGVASVVPLASDAAAAPCLGTPGYRVLRSTCGSTGTRTLTILAEFPTAPAGFAPPRHRLVGAYEQRVEAPDVRFVYAVIAAPPYANAGFKIPAGGAEGSAYWDADARTYTLNVAYPPAAQPRPAAAAAT